MKYLIIFLFSLSSFLYSQDKLIFDQGEQWGGQITAMNDQLVKLKNSFSKDELKFKLNNLNAIEFSGTKPLTGTHKITLINGDGFTGDLEELNNDFLVLKTLCSGIMQIPRNYVSIIEPLSDVQLIEGGISNKDGWSGNISSTGTFQGSISREINSKEPFIISTEVDLENAYSFYVMLNNKRTDEKQQKFYFYTNIGTSRGIVIINGVKQVNKQSSLRVSANIANNNERMTFGSLTLPEGSKLVNVKIFFNPKENFAAVNVNNIEIGKAKLTSKFEFEKLLVSLRSNGGKPYLRKFKIEKWDGKYTSYIIADKDEKNDNIILKNDDLAFGKVSSIKGKKLTFTSKLGKHELSMELISSIILLNSKSDPIKKNHILRLESGQKITGNLQKIDDDFIYIRNDLFPNLKIKREYCRTVNNSNFQRTKNSQTITSFGENKVFGTIELLNDKTLVVNNINLMDKLTLDIDKADNIHFNNKTKIDDADWLIDLVNGDSLPCKIKLFNSEEIQITSNTGNFKINTSDAIRLYKRLSKPRSNARSASFSYNNNLIDIKLPVKSEINFTIKKNTDSKTNNFSTMFQMRLFGEKRGTRNSYHLQLSQNPRVYFKKSIQPEMHQQIKFKENNDISFKIDKEKAIFELWVNGIHTHTFKDPDGFQGKGNGFVFYNSNWYKISKLRFNEWNKDTLDTDTFVISDDWKIYKGQITSIDNGRLTIGNDNLALKDIREVSLRSSKEPAKKSAYKMRLINHATLNIDSFSIEGSKVNIQHPLMGKMTLDKGNIAEIIAN